MADSKEQGTYKLQTASGGDPQTIIIQIPERKRRWWLVLLGMLLIAGIAFGMLLMLSGGPVEEGPTEKFYSGDRLASDKIAVIEVTGTIMPPFTERTLATIKKIKKDSAVKGVVLVVDSPGGLVADSHQIYHRLKELEVPITVVMKRLAASGGYYISMGAGTEGKIYAEPTCWTGSIGVIIPRYNAKELADKIGVKSEPLKTGPFKDALSPFNDLSPEERAVWDEIMDQSFDRFLTIIDENRDDLNREQVEKIATGQIYTADQALENNLIDVIGFEDDAIEDLQKQLKLGSVRVVRYEQPKTLVDLLMGATAKGKADPVSDLAKNMTPRPYYLCSWGLLGPSAE